MSGLMTGADVSWAGLSRISTGPLSEQFCACACARHPGITASPEPPLRSAIAM